MKPSWIRLIAAAEFLAYYSIAPAVSLLVFDQERGLLGKDIAYSYRIFIYTLFIGLYPLLQIFSAPIIGKKADTFSRKKILQTIHLANILGYSFFALSSIIHNLALAFAGLLLPAVAGSVLPILKASLASSSKPEERTKEFMKFAMVKGSMSVVGPLFGLVLSYTASFLFAALLSFFAFICTSMQQFPKQFFSIPPETDTSSFLRQHFWYFSIFFLTFLCYCLFIKFAPVLLAERFGIHWINYFFIICGLATVFNQFIFLRIFCLKSWSIPLLLMLQALSIALLCAMSSYASSLFCLFVALFSFSITTIQIESTLSLFSSSFNQGKIQGILFSVENASYLCAPLLGFLLATHRTLDAIIAAAFIAGFATTIYYLKIIANNRKARAANIEKT